MKNNRNYGLYAIAIAIALVGALTLGVPVGTLAVLALAAACPLMMFFMMRGLRDGDDMDSHGHDDAPKDRDPDGHKPFR
ncbi:MULTISPECIES: DUF2933 domain-containing protein [unclassified Streptomyces]|uniref:DUF2933 domain-containing protein n=1 Tax=unclassified Streptomyces TaxID=2593676 RepID=UPI002E2CB9F9|nr:DUF2933 domain-containing protein [Streptomyces sp. NBC_01439]